jgi:hypothetical protein
MERKMEGKLVRGRRGRRHKHLLGKFKREDPGKW